MARLLAVVTVVAAAIASMHGLAWVGNFGAGSLGSARGQRSPPCEAPSRQMNQQQLQHAGVAMKDSYSEEDFLGSIHEQHDILDAMDALMMPASFQLVARGHEKAFPMPPMVKNGRFSFTVAPYARDQDGLWVTLVMKEQNFDGSYSEVVDPSMEQFFRESPVFVRRTFKTVVRGENGRLNGLLRDFDMTAYGVASELRVPEFAHEHVGAN